MTVKELIKELQELHPDIVVTDSKGVEILTINFKRDEQGDYFELTQ